MRKTRIEFSLIVGSVRYIRYVNIFIYAKSIKCLYITKNIANTKFFLVDGKLWAIGKLLAYGTHC